MAVKMDEEIIALKSNFKNWTLWPLVILGVMIVEALLSFFYTKKNTGFQKKARPLSGKKSGC